MQNRTLFPVLMLAVMFFSAPRGAAAFDFNGSSGPLDLKAAAVPATPAPAPAAPKSCKPFLLEVAVGGVSEKVILERSCTPESEPVWAITVERGPAGKIFVKVVSDQYPAQRAKLESRIKSMVTEGLGQEDADFIVMKTGAALKQAETAGPREKSRILFAATLELKEHLAR